MAIKMTITNLLRRILSQCRPASFPIRSGPVLMAGIALGLAVPASAQQWPERAVKLIVPYSVGGPLDISTRLLANELTTALGQPVVVENKAGAGGGIGAQLVAQSAPDGYSFLIGANATNAINPSLIGVSYKPIDDFRFVSLMLQVPNVVVTHPDLPVQSVQDLIAYAKANPSKLDISGTFGSVGHLASELFKRMTDTDMVFIPYKGSAPAVADLLGGRTHLMFDNLASALPHIKSGKLRALAVTTKARSAYLPDVPTLHESGLEGFDMSTWWGIMAPANTPTGIVNRLNKEALKILDKPEIRERLDSMAAGPLDIRSPEQFTAFAQSELKLYTDLVNEFNLAIKN